MDTTITITSRMAEAFEYPETTWTGAVQLATTEPEDRLELIFRLFNRVDDSDCERLEKWGYKLPSLSTGDSVTMEGKTYRCESMGWQEVQ